MTKFSRYIVLLSFAIFCALSGCYPDKSLAKPSSTSSQVTPNELPGLNFQLTYVTSFVSEDRQYQGIFAMDVQCLDKETPCFGPPELLLKIPRQNDANPLKPYGDITSYSWSPDGKKIIFSAAGRDERGDVFISDWDGGNLKNITMSPEYEDSPSWSTDNHLVYIVCSGRCHAVVSDEHGTSITPFEFDTEVDFATWLSNGEQLLFVGTDDNSIYQIYTAGIDGSNIRQITHTSDNNIVPDASTNGELIFFTRSQSYQHQNFNYNVFSIDIAGKIENAITAEKVLISINPSVAPFGNWIAFEQGRDLYDIYISSFDGKQIFQITEGEGNKTIPEWRVVTNP